MNASRFWGKIVIVTGGGSGIGARLAKAFDQEGAVVAVCDIRKDIADDVATNQLRNPLRPKTGYHVDVTNAEQVRYMIQDILEKYGTIDIYCSNAGIIQPYDEPKEGESGITRYSEAKWKRLIEVNALSHLIAVQELLKNWNQGRPGSKPSFIMTASAAGLLTQIGDASYGVSKAAAVSFAEHLAIEHSDRLRVLCICPQAVDTSFGEGMVQKTNNSAKKDGVISPSIVAACTLDALSSQVETDPSLFIFPHPEVATYVKRKGVDHTRWLKGMIRFKKKQEQQMMKSKL
ncbi:unnamed protein product [Cylindrotheca closterium]|uniref:Uncharacterized protein n=1 Tax=Cylindrotheca closterium TaxID=2856 RepID=A0AAD2PU70_9STRA|nr:unnamed protein product [Cylindrotheca closterium]